MGLAGSKQALYPGKQAMQNGQQIKFLTRNQQENFLEEFSVSMLERYTAQQRVTEILCQQQSPSSYLTEDKLESTRGETEAQQAAIKQSLIKDIKEFSLEQMQAWRKKINKIHETFKKLKPDQGTRSELIQKDELKSLEILGQAISTLNQDVMKIVRDFGGEAIPTPFTKQETASKDALHENLSVASKSGLLRERANETWRVPRKDDLRELNTYVSSKTNIGVVQAVKESSLASARSKLKSSSSKNDFFQELQNFTQNFDFSENFDFTQELGQHRNTFDTVKVTNNFLGRRKIVDDSQRRSLIAHDDSIDIKIASPGYNFTAGIVDNETLMRKVTEKASSSIGKLSARASYRSSVYENPGIRWNVERRSPVDPLREGLNSSSKSLQTVNHINEKSFSHKSQQLKSPDIDTVSQAHENHQNQILQFHVPQSSSQITSNTSEPCATINPAGNQTEEVEAHIKNADTTSLQILRKRHNNLKTLFDTPSPYQPKKANPSKDVSKFEPFEGSSKLPSNQEVLTQEIYDPDLSDLKRTQTVLNIDSKDCALVSQSNALCFLSPNLIESTSDQNLRECIFSPASPQIKQAKPLNVKSKQDQINDEVVKDKKLMKSVENEDQNSRTSQTLKKSLQNIFGGMVHQSVEILEPKGSAELLSNSSRNFNNSQSQKNSCKDEHKESSSDRSLKSFESPKLREGKQQGKYEKDCEDPISDAPNLRGSSVKINTKLSYEFYGTQKTSIDSPNEEHAESSKGVKNSDSATDSNSLKFAYESLNFQQQPKKDLSTPEAPRKEKYLAEQRSSSIFISDNYTPTERNSVDFQARFDDNSHSKASMCSRQSFEINPILIADEIQHTPKNSNILEQGVFDLDCDSAKKSQEFFEVETPVELELEDLSAKSSAQEESSELLQQRKSSTNGFSDLDKIVNYLKCLFTAINEQIAIQKAIKLRLNTPIGPNNIQKVKLCSPPLINFLQHHFDQEEEAIEVFGYEPVLGIELYIQLEDIMKQTLYAKEKLSETSVERRHILHKLVYDCLNEALDYRRIWGLEGQPFGFTTNFKMPKAIEMADCAEILEETRNKVLVDASMRAGIIQENEPGLENMETIDGLEVLREEVLNNLLSEYVEDVELKWSKLRDETHEVVFCLADDIFYMLVDEIFCDLGDIKDGKKSTLRPVNSSASLCLESSRPYLSRTDKPLKIRNFGFLQKPEST